MLSFADFFFIPLTPGTFVLLRSEQVSFSYQNIHIRKATGILMRKKWSHYPDGDSGTILQYKEEKLYGKIYNPGKGTECTFIPQEEEGLPNSTASTDMDLETGHLQMLLNKMGSHWIKITPSTMVKLSKDSST